MGRHPAQPAQRLVGLAAPRSAPSRFTAGFATAWRRTSPTTSSSARSSPAKGDLSATRLNRRSAGITCCGRRRRWPTTRRRLFSGRESSAAQCHHHPYEKWSQDDYWGLAAFFARVQTAPVKTNVPKDGRGLKTVSIPRRARYQPPRARATPAPALDGRGMPFLPGKDPREELAEWMSARTIPFWPGPWSTATGLISSAGASRDPEPYPGHQSAEQSGAARCPGQGLPGPPVRPETPGSDPLHEPDLSALQYARTNRTERPGELLPASTRDGWRPRYCSMRWIRSRPCPQLGGRCARAIDLPDENVKKTLLDGFGKPSRSSACECERI